MQDKWKVTLSVEVLRLRPGAGGGIEVISQQSSSFRGLGASPGAAYKEAASEGFEAYTGGLPEVTGEVIVAGDN